MADDPYDVLGLDTGASPRQVLEAYRALVQIYHPDRYAEAPERVREEALRRMQAVNSAYDELGRPAPRTAPTAAASTAPRSPAGSAPPPRREPPRPTAPPRQGRPRLDAVLYVDGSRHYHHPAVAPLGLDLHAAPVRPAAGAATCAVLDGELGRWWQNQSRNASMTDKLMYAAWGEEQRALYTATVGCSEVLLDSVETFASPCGECRPR
jgi:hypothetical protein